MCNCVQEATASAELPGKYGKLWQGNAFVSHACPDGEACEKKIKKIEMMLGAERFPPRRPTMGVGGDVGGRGGVA